MLARAADAEGDLADATSGYAAALAASPDDAVVAMRAYRHGLAVGDMALAERAALVLVQNGAAAPDVEIFITAEAIHSGDRKLIAAAIARLGKSPLGFLAPSLRGWLAHDEGKDFAAALETGGSAFSRRFAVEQRALLLIADRRGREGAAMIGAMAASDEDGMALRTDAARLLAATHQGSLARALMAHTGFEGKLAKARPGIAFGAARLFTALASDLAKEDVGPLSILLTRSALWLDPGNDGARVLLADALSRENAIAQALGVLDEVRGDSVLQHDARVARIVVLGRAGRSDEALALARTLAEAPEAREVDVEHYGGLLADSGQYEAAAKIFGDAVARAGDQADWTLLLQQASALDNAGHWDQALPILRKVVERAPDAPIALNYLGYGLADRGQDLPEAQKMLEKARKLRPDDNSIADSLAWAYFKQGDVARALPLLEKAARGEPANSEINEHLGDAYWHVGRRFEARYAWRAAAVYADGADAKRLADKLANGIAPIGKN